MPKPLKDLYNNTYISLLADTTLLHYSSLDAKSFKNTVFDKQWKNKELKQRMRHIAICLHSFLPTAYNESIAILENVFMGMNHSYNLENMLFQDFVEVYGLEHFDASMYALRVFTINSSSEFAIRQFILRYPNKTMATMKEWAQSNNEHLRRLASEGCRPRLPWAIALPLFKANPNAVIEILDLLKDDPSPYVRKSVANNLNDISKDNPSIVKELTKKWIGKNQDRDWILKHGCRTLLKNSDTETLKLFGFIKNDTLTIKEFVVDKKVFIGENLDFSFLLDADKGLEKLRVEFTIEFVRLNNKFSKKVFKITEGVFDATQKSFKKTYSFKKITTRKYYAGAHKLSVIVNGVVMATKAFTVEEERKNIPND